MAVGAGPAVHAEGRQTTNQEKEVEVQEHAVEPAVIVFSTTSALCTSLALLYLVAFINDLFGSITGSLAPYVASEFSDHGLLPMLLVVSRTVSSILRLPMARLVNKWGRVDGFVVSIGLVTLGLILLAACQNFITFAAGSIITGLGTNLFHYVVFILLADMTSLRNRILMFGIYSTPLIATTFAGPKIAELFQREISWRWAFGSFAIILIGSCIPVAVVLSCATRAVRRTTSEVDAGRADPARRRSFWVAAKHYAVEFDVIGITLVISGLCLTFLPPSLAHAAADGWRSAGIVTMLFLGVTALLAFILWERWWAPVALMPWALLRNKTILSACLVGLYLVASVGCWEHYYVSYLQVVHGQTISSAGYIVNVFVLACAIVGPFLGLLIRVTGNYKAPALCGIPVFGAATGLLLAFHGSETPVGLLVMCQILLGISVKIISECGCVAVMASMEQKEVATGLGIYGTMVGLGVALGTSISGAIWTNVVPGAIEAGVASQGQGLAEKLYGSLVEQLRYPPGHPTREAVVAAYWAAQQSMVIAGVCFVPLAGVCVLMWKNGNVKSRREDADAEARPRGKIW